MAVLPVRTLHNGTRLPQRLRRCHRSERSAGVTYPVPKMLSSVIACDKCEAFTLGSEATEAIQSVSGDGLLRFARDEDYSKSPPTALAVVPCSRNALMTFLPIFHLCTSSGPSTSRCARTWVYHLASGVSWLKPSAPWSWIAVSITLCTICAWKILAIEFSCRMSRPFSAL